METLLRVVAATLCVEYLAAAGLRAMVAFRIAWLKRDYLLSVPVCLALSLGWLRILWTGVASPRWTLLGALAATGAVIHVFMRPAVKVLHQQQAHERKAGDGG